MIAGGDACEARLARILEALAGVRKSQSRARLLPETPIAHVSNLMAWLKGIDELRTVFGDAIGGKGSSVTFVISGWRGCLLRASSLSPCDHPRSPKTAGGRAEGRVRPFS